MTPLSLADFIAIFQERRRLILVILCSAVILSLAAYRLQAPSSAMSLILSVTRSGKDSTADYRYDEFYRLQADERFADTLVQYVKTPQALRNIEERAGLTPSEAGYFLANGLEAKRLSSNLISLSAHLLTDRSAQTLADAVPDVLNTYAEDLNRSADEPDWFEVIASESDISDARFSLEKALLVGLLSGIFIAFWVALLDSYWKKGKASEHENRD